MEVNEHMWSLYVKHSFNTGLGLGLILQFINGLCSVQFPSSIQRVLQLISTYYIVAVVIK